jgi:DNA repair protein RecO (recombination protein O)
VHWSDSGLVLSARRHGESSLVVSILTESHGRHGGLAKGGTGRSGRGLYQPGNHVDCEWHARLPDHLGNWRVELRRGFAAEVLDEPPALTALSSVCALLDRIVPEREPHAGLFGATHILLLSIAQGEAHWPELYIRWELGLLAELGFGLDLGTCAATGVAKDLTHVSPRSGRAVSREAAAPYRERLFPLPAFLTGGRGGPPANDVAIDIAQGLALTGFFLERRILQPQGGRLPAARTRLVEQLVKRTSISGI